MTLHDDPAADEEAVVWPRGEASRSMRGMKRPLFLEYNHHLKSY